ncbi:hypothetical protein [Tenggerimyces flavus]|uniref:Secreted protein n=1 Tax=Tenggerimyces flavus TaxID=1708749 RepID=A0ABV7Y7D3_9ACTN|nr:hypothetical protein [Tenggerimyces flavus]MBM7785140.1 hypothetical protein [Tenggerimyces flavus]
MKRSRILAALAVATVAVLANALPATAADDPPGTSDECSFVWATVDPIGDGWYFGDARLNCPVATDLGWRWELDGREIERAADGRRGPGEVPIFDDIEVHGTPGQELCFFPTAWGNDRGSACLTI